MSVQTFDTRALNMLAARLVEEENRRAESILKGSPESFEDYREQVGFLRGLMFARTRCEDVEKDLLKGK